MARETVYIVQSFIAGRGNRLKADTPISCKTENGARQMAERLGQTKIGVVAFSSSADIEQGEYDEEPVVLFKTGRLPDQFEN